MDDLSSLVVKRISLRLIGAGLTARDPAEAGPLLRRDITSPCLRRRGDLRST